MTTKSENAQALEQLDLIEQKVMNLLKIASRTCDMLACVDVKQEETLKGLITEFVNLVKEIQRSLKEQLNHLIDNNPYLCSVSTYGAKKDLEIMKLKAELLSEQLQIQSQNIDTKIFDTSSHQHQQ